MLFNLDRQTKQSILNQYKQEALDHEKKKQMERQRKIQEEREYLAQNEKKEIELEDKKRNERLRKQAEVMNDYQNMLKTTSDRRNYHSRIEDVKINNYGYNIGFDNYNSQPQPQNMQNNYNSQRITPVHNNNPENNRQLTPNQKERALIRREDHMGNYLTDRVNENELKSFYQNQKQDRQKYYKEMLDMQCQQRAAAQQPIYETRNANIINYQKRFRLPADPYNLNRNQDFGQSTLTHNPITNPTNNMQYNKYINVDQFTNQNEQNNYGGNGYNNYNNFNSNSSNPGVGGNNYSNYGNNFNGNNYYPPNNSGNGYNNYNNIDSNNPQPYYQNNQMNQPNYNYNQGYGNQNNYNNNRGVAGQYQRDQHQPTPTGQTLRQAASNFLQ